jgi:hypothetical protein
MSQHNDLLGIRMFTPFFVISGREGQSGLVLKMFRTPDAKLA